MISRADQAEYLKNLTVVIPSINHPFLLERAIEYWRKISVVVHIIDGSKDALFDESDFKLCPNIHYHHRQFADDKWSNFFGIMNFASTIPKTKYAAICGDDDFFTVSGLVASLKILENNSRVDAVLGRLAYFRETSNSRKWSVKGLSHQPSEAQQSSDLLERKDAKSSWLMYGIVKTEIWSQIFNFAYSNRLSHLDAHELLVRELSWIMCRTVLTDRILSIRQYTISGSNIGEQVKLSDWLIDPRNTDAVDQIVKRLVIGVINTDPTFSAGSAEEIVKEVLSRYTSVKQQRQVKSTSSRRNLLKFIPRFLKIGAAFVIDPKRALQASTFRLGTFIMLLRKSKLEFSPAEIREVSRILRANHAEFLVKSKIHQLAH